jgi:hypothetical protein
MIAVGKMEHGKTRRRGLNEPVSAYEAPPGSWMRAPEKGCRAFSGAEFAPKPAFIPLFFKHIK